MLTPWRHILILIYVNGLFFDNGEFSSGEAKPREDKLQDGQQQLRHQNNSQLYEEKASGRNGTTLSHEDQVRIPHDILFKLLYFKLKANPCGFSSACFFVYFVPPNLWPNFL